MDELPLIILKRIFKYVPKRSLEEVVVKVCSTWKDVAFVIISEEVEILPSCVLPPGHSDDIDLKQTRCLTISAGWTCNWWTIPGVKRTYFEDLLRELNPKRLKSISTPIRNEEQMKIIGSLPNLRRVELELLKPSVADRYLPHLLRLRNLDAINLAGFHTFNEDHFKQITEAATVLTEFSFPTGTPWAQKEYLSLLKPTYIRTIQPWSYIGGDGEGQLYSLVINVLTQLTDLIQVHIYMGDFIRSNPEAQSPKIDQGEEFIKVMATLSNQTAVTNLVIGRHELTFPIDGNAVAEGISHLQTTLTDFGFFAGFQQRVYYNDQNEQIGTPEDFSMIYQQLSKLAKLRSLHLSGITKDADVGEIFENCPLTALHIEMENIEEFLPHLSKVPNIDEFTLAVPSGLGQSEDDIYRIQSALKRFAPTIHKLKLSGAFVESSFVSELPGMPLLQSVQLIPQPSRWHSPVLLTDDVVSFAGRCPELISPRFLRYPKLLSTIPISEGPPNAEVDENGCGSIHPNWRLYSQTVHSA